MISTQKLRVTDFQRRHVFEEIKKNDEHDKTNETEEIMVLKDPVKVRVITMNYIL